MAIHGVGSTKVFVATFPKTAIPVFAVPTGSLCHRTPGRWKREIEVCGRTPLLIGGQTFALGAKQSNGVARLEVYRGGGRNRDELVCRTLTISKQPLVLFRKGMICYPLTALMLAQICDRLVAPHLWRRAGEFRHD